MVKSNLQLIVVKAQDVLQMWVNHPLTLTGRVLVINTLVESLFVYRLTVLPYVDNKWFRELQNIIVNFVWKNKRPKISYNVLKCSKKDGGLRLVDFQAKHKSLLCKWVYDIQDDALLCTQAWNALNPTLKNHIWLINAKKSTVEQFCGRKSFWSGVLIAWCEYTYIFPMTYEQVKNQFLWVNEFIKVNNQPIFYVQLYHQGCMYIKDILDDNNCILTYDEQLPTNYANGVLWLEYHSLVSAIPSRWKNVLSQKVRRDECYQHTYERLMPNKKRSHIIYSDLTSNKLACVDSYNR